MISESTEILYGKVWAKIARAEGHRRKFPIVEDSNKPRPTNMRQKLLDHFAKDATPLTTTQMGEILGAKRATMGQVCRQMLHENLLVEHKKPNGRFFTLPQSSS